MLTLPHLMICVKDAFLLKMPRMRLVRIGQAMAATSPLSRLSLSHRRALLVAKDRNSTWTAIFEDDAVPVDQTNFNTNFRKVWGQVPEGVGYVRLGWCPFTHDEQTTNFTYDHFRLVSGLPVGGCTTAYMVHRDIIPTLLGLFPCCSSLDACLNSDLFATPSLCGRTIHADVGGRNT